MSRRRERRQYLLVPGLSLVGGIVTGAAAMSLFGHDLSFCAPEEYSTGCVRDWVTAVAAILLIPVGLLVLRQVAVTRRQLFLPAVGRLDEANAQLGVVRTSLLAIEVFLEHLVEVLSKEPKNAPDALLLINEMKEQRHVDTMALSKAIIRSHLTEELHDKCMVIAGEWTSWQRQLDILADLLREALETVRAGKKVAAAKQEERDKIVATILTTAPAIRKLIGEIREPLQAIFLANQRRLLRIDKAVINEIDRLT